MRYISFAWTTPALLANGSRDPNTRRLAKTVTRRDWDPHYAAVFKKGDVVAGFDRSPRIGGRKIAEVELLADPVLESTADMPDADYYGEGYAFLYLHPECLPKTVRGRSCTRDDFSLEAFRYWRACNELLYVVRFKFVRAMPWTRVNY